MLKSCLLTTSLGKKYLANVLTTCRCSILFYGAQNNFLTRWCCPIRARTFHWHRLFCSADLHYGWWRFADQNTLYLYTEIIACYANNKLATSPWSKNKISRIEPSNIIMTTGYRMHCLWRNHGIVFLEYYALLSHPQQQFSNVP